MFLTRRVDGAKLRALREDAGLTLQALADRIAALDDKKRGASRGYLSRVENDPTLTPTGVYIGLIARALGVSVDDFSTREPAQDAA